MELWLILGILGFLSYAVSTSIDKYLMNRKYEVVKTDAFKMLFDGLILVPIGLAFFSLNFSMEIFPWALVLGFLYALSGIIYFEVLSLEDVEEAMPIYSMRILLIFVASLFFFSEAASLFNWIGIVLILVGIYSVMSENGLKLPKINKIFFLILGGVLVGVVYSLLTKQFLFQAKPIDLVVMMYFCCASVLFVYQFFFKKHPLKSMIKFEKKMPKILVASFFGGIGTFLIYSALAVGNASKVYPLSGLFTIFVFIFASIFLKEKFYWHRLLGTILVFLGIFLVSL